MKTIISPEQASHYKKVKQGFNYDTTSQPSDHRFGTIIQEDGKQRYVVSVCDSRVCHELFSGPSMWTLNEDIEKEC